MYALPNPRMKIDIGKVNSIASCPFPSRTAIFFLSLCSVCCPLSYEGMKLECKTDEGINEQQSKQPERDDGKRSSKLEYTSNVAAK